MLFSVQNRTSGLQNSLQLQNKDFSRLKMHLLFCFSFELRISRLYLTAKGVATAISTDTDARFYFSNDKRRFCQGQSST